MNNTFLRVVPAASLLAVSLVLRPSTIRAESYQERWNTIVSTLSTHGITSHPKPGIYTALAKMAAGDTAGGLDLADRLFRNPSDAAMFFIMGGGDWVARYHHKMSAAQISSAQGFLFRDDLIAANGDWWSKGTSKNHHTMFAAGHFLTQQTFPSWSRAGSPMPVLQGDGRSVRAAAASISPHAKKAAASPTSVPISKSMPT